MAAVDYFLKLDGIPGESQDKAHKDEIQLESFSWGAANTGSRAAGGGGGAGKVNMQDFTFTQKTNKSSPKLFLSCATGEHIKAATLTARKAGKDQIEFLTIKLTDVIVTSFQETGDDGEYPLEEIALDFAKIEVSYKPTGADGKAAAELKAGWDIKANKKV